MADRTPQLARPRTEIDQMQEHFGALIAMCEQVTIEERTAGAEYDVMGNLTRQLKIVSNGILEHRKDSQTANRPTVPPARFKSEPGARRCRVIEFPRGTA